MRGLPRVYRRPVPRLLPAAAALLLTACGSGTTTPGQPAAPEGCPASVVVSPAERVPVPVPQDPTAETTGRLVPQEPPTSARVCTYGPVDGDAEPGPVALSGDVALTGGLERVPQDLLLPRATGGGGACTPAPGPVAGRLLRLTYPDGVVWVSAGDGCGGTGNGPFRSDVDRADLLAASAAAGAWTAPDQPDAAQRCVPERAGRRGQEAALLPAGATSLVLCRVAGDGVARRSATPAQQQAVQDVLDEPVAVPSTGGCPGGGGTQYELAARYPAGPAVVVRFTDGCRPDVDNGSLAAQLEPAGLARLRALLQAAFA